MKAIAGNASCVDGFSRFFDPIEFKVGWGEDLELKHVIQHLNSLKKNTCDVVWDGAPVYYDNFETTEREGYGIFGGFAGDLMGSSLGDFSGFPTIFVLWRKFLMPKKAIFVL